MRLKQMVECMGFVLARKYIPSKCFASVCDDLQLQVYENYHQLRWKASKSSSVTPIKFKFQVNILIKCMGEDLDKTGGHNLREVLDEDFGAE